VTPTSAAITTDWVPHDAKVCEAGAPGARTRIAGRKTIPPRAVRREALRAGSGGAAILSNGVGRGSARVQKDARAQPGLSRRGRLALPLSVLARAGAGEGAELRLPEMQRKCGGVMAGVRPASAISWTRSIAATPQGTAKFSPSHFDRNTARRAKAARAKIGGRRPNLISAHSPDSDGGAA